MVVAGCDAPSMPFVIVDVSRICTTSLLDDVTASRAPFDDSASADGRLPPTTSAPFSGSPIRVLATDCGVDVVVSYVHTDDDAAVLYPPIVSGGSPRGDCLPAGSIASAAWV